MDKLYSVKDICDRYQCKPATARKYMRDMAHLEQPLMVSERALKAWEERKTLPPESETRRMIKERGCRRA